MRSGTDYTRNECPNKESQKCPNCDGAHSAASKECPAFIIEQASFRIQAKKRCPLPDVRKQAGQPVTAEQATNSYAQVTANSQANLVNRNLALSDENARLKEVINTLRQDNASLQQRLVSWEYRLQILEKALMGGAHPNSSVDGVKNTTSVGSAHNSTPVGDAHNPSTVGDAHTRPVSMANMASQTENGNTPGPYVSVSPQLLKAKHPTDAPSYIYKQSPNPKMKVELNRKGPSSIPVTSPITKPAELRNHRKNNKPNQGIMATTILQWNIRGLRCNRRDFDILVSEHQPDVVCLQKTKLEHSPPASHYQCGNYDCYFKSLRRNPDQLPCGGVSIYIKKGLYHHQVQMDSHLQAVAVQVTYKILTRSSSGGRPLGL